MSVYLNFDSVLHKKVVLYSPLLIFILFPYFVLYIIKYILI